MFQWIRDVFHRHEASRLEFYFCQIPGETYPFFITMTGTVSIISYVVKRFPHFKHSLRRLILSPSSVLMGINNFAFLIKTKRTFHKTALHMLITILRLYHIKSINFNLFIKIFG